MENKGHYRVDCNYVIAVNPSIVLAQPMKGPG